MVKELHEMRNLCKEINFEISFHKVQRTLYGLDDIFDTGTFWITMNNYDKVYNEILGRDFVGFN